MAHLRRDFNRQRRCRAAAWLRPVQKRCLTFSNTRGAVSYCPTSAIGASCQNMLNSTELVGLRLLTLFYGATLVLLLLFFTKISILHIMDVLGCHIK